MKKTSILALLLTISSFLFAQNKRWLAGVSVGPAFSKFANSKAPHASFLGMEAPYYYAEQEDLETIIDNSSYETKFGDMRTGISAELEIEYFIRQGFSIRSGLSYEAKGMGLKRTGTTFENITWSGPTEVRRHDTYKIKNDYVSIPLSFRKYLFEKQRFFVDAGAFAGYLISSKSSLKRHQTEFTEPDIFNESDNTYVVTDVKKEHTRNFDFGLSAGAGYAKNISDKWVLNIALQASFGLLTLDSKNNNEFSVNAVPWSQGYQYVVISKNYYGYNSDAKNVGLVFRVGVGYVLGD